MGQYTLLVSYSGYASKVFRTPLDTLEMLNSYNNGIKLKSMLDL
jgi:hypothetical protein